MKRVFVTGVSRGIGRSIAERFLSEGYELWGTYFRSEDKARELEEYFGKERVHLLGPYDFRDLSQTKTLLSKLKEYTFDSVVSNIGMFSECDDFNDFCLEEYTETMNCNLMSPTILLIGLKDNIQIGGSITIISSIDAVSGAYKSISYSVSKAGLISLGKCLAVNYGSKKIRVNVISPGVIDTDMNTPQNCTIAPLFTPIQRVGEPEDIASVVCFLSSEGASFINGQTITVDGGYSVSNVLLLAEGDSNIASFLYKFAMNDNGG